MINSHQFAGSTKSSSRTKKTSFFRNALDNAKNRPKELFNLIRQQTSKPPASSVRASKDLCDNFANFFNDKITKIELSLDNNRSPPYKSPSPGTEDITPKHPPKPRKSFNPIPEAEIVKLISTSKPSSHVLETFPAQMTKKLKLSQGPLWSKIINSSLRTGVIPDCLKVGQVTPLLKKPGLDTNDLNNFRSVSNLPLLSKILKRCILLQLIQHMDSINLLDPHNRVSEKAAALRP